LIKTGGGGRETPPAGLAPSFRAFHRLECQLELITDFGYKGTNVV